MKCPKCNADNGTVGYGRKCKTQTCKYIIGECPNDKCKKPFAIDLKATKENNEDVKCEFCPQLVKTKYDKFCHNCKTLNKVFAGDQQPKCKNCNSTLKGKDEARDHAEMIPILNRPFTKKYGETNTGWAHKFTTNVTEFNNGIESNLSYTMTYYTCPDDSWIQILVENSGWTGVISVGCNYLANFKTTKVKDASDMFVIPTGTGTDESWGTFAEIASKVPNGGHIFKKATSAKPAALPVKVSLGNASFGLVHIIARHRKSAFSFANLVKEVKSALTNPTEIYYGGQSNGCDKWGLATSGGFLIFTLRNGFYSLTTCFPKGSFTNGKSVWKKKT